MNIARILQGLFPILCAIFLSAVPSHAQAPNADLIVKGQYLATAGDCIACHTVPGGTSFTGGRAFKLPFGMIYSRNITPDRETGIGTWNDDDFVTAMQRGVAKGGEHLYPAFPYTAYTKLSRDDVLAIKAYLFSLAPVRNTTPEDKLSFPFNQRWALAFWNVLFNSDKRFEPDAKQSADWNRGAYLVEALEHCGECHTPRRFTQSLDNSQKFAGTIAQGWMAYNITADAQSGLGNWSDEALVSYLSTGHADGHSSASGPMLEAVTDSLSHLKTQDIHAIVVYLRSIAPIKTVPAIAPNPPARGASTPPTAGLGEQIFAGECANCHGWDGIGVQSPYATLLGSRTLNDPEATNLMAVVIAGSGAPSSDHPRFMPPFGNGRSDDELAAVTNFANGYFGNGTSKVTADEVAKARKAMP
jgi:mono/diheme cytochrome c family protein